MVLALAMAEIDVRSFRLTVDEAIASRHLVGRAWTCKTDVYPQLNVGERDGSALVKGGEGRMMRTR